MSHLPEVVITGWGVVSPIGIGKEAFAASLRPGRSGVARISQSDVICLPVPIGAEIKQFDAKQYVKPRKSLKVMGREIQTAVAAAALAMEDARIAKGQFDPDRMGVVLATETMCSEYAEVEDVYRACMADGEFRDELWATEAMGRIYPLWMLKYLPNMPACHIAIAYDARGPNNSIAVGEVSSLLAVAEGAGIIQRGDADLMLVGGSSSRVNLTDILWRGDARMSHRVDDPEAASRPFDAGRDGMIVGEGAAVFLLERREHAQQRGATEMARVLGCGNAFLPPRPGCTPNGRAIHNAIGQALERSQLRADDIGHVNAHGLSTVADDRSEAEAISATLSDVPVTAPKSFFGNFGAGGGAVEMAASLLALADGFVPYTLNYANPDPDCPVNVVRGEPLGGRTPTAMLLNHAGTGQAAALVLAAD